MSMSEVVQGGDYLYRYFADTESVHMDIGSVASEGQEPPANEPPNVTEVIPEGYLLSWTAGDAMVMTFMGTGFTGDEIMVWNGVEKWPVNDFRSETEVRGPVPAGTVVETVQVCLRNEFGDSAEFPFEYQTG